MEWSWGASLPRQDQSSGTVDCLLQPGLFSEDMDLGFQITLDVLSLYGLEFGG